jgi:hypothetical protein
VSKTQFFSEQGRATKVASSRLPEDVGLMSVILAARDVLKQPCLASICGTSDVMKVSVTVRLFGSSSSWCVTREGLKITRYQIPRVFVMWLSMLF